MTPPQLKLVIDSIVWAFRHTERNVAEEGLSLLLVRAARGGAFRAPALARFGVVQRSRAARGRRGRRGARRAGRALPPPPATSHAPPANSPAPPPGNFPPPPPPQGLLENFSKNPCARDALLQGLLPAAAARGGRGGGCLCEGGGGGGVPSSHAVARACAEGAFVDAGRGGGRGARSPTEPHTHTQNTLTPTKYKIQNKKHETQTTPPPQVFAVLTDTFHKPGFKMHARILMHLLLIARDPAAIREPLWDAAAAGAPPYGSNIEYVAQYAADLLSASFPNMPRAQARRGARRARGRGFARRRARAGGGPGGPPPRALAPRAARPGPRPPRAPRTATLTPCPPPTHTRALRPPPPQRWSRA